MMDGRPKKLKGLIAPHNYPFRQCMIALQEFNRLSARGL